MKEAKELFEAITPIRRQIAKKCLAYLKRELKRNNGSIDFFSLTNCGDDVVDVNDVEVINF